MRRRHARARTGAVRGSLTAILAVVVGVSVLGPSTVPASAAAPKAKGLAAHVRGALLVGFTDRASARDRAAARQTVGAVASERLSPLAPDAERWTLSSEAALGSALEALSRMPYVRYAEPDYLLTSQVTSDDPYYLGIGGNLWGMHGDAIGPNSNAFGTGADEAWARGTTGSSDVYVGVIDEGIQFTHPDLAANIWTNPLEVENGIDDDRNGYVDDIHGWDFVNNDSSIYDAGGDSHGTHVSGTIGGVGGNGLGVAGVNWNVTIISGKFLGTAGGSTSDAVRALDYMTALKRSQGIDIVATSNSWGGGGYSTGLLDAIERGGDEGILFIAAAGNSNYDNDSTASYPSNYECTKGGTRGWDCVIAVAAIDSAGAKASFSSYGARTVDLGAPGVSVYSTLPTDSYGSYSGTSMATPHVSGAVALCESIDPSLTAPGLRALLLGATMPTASLSGRTSTGGRLDVGTLAANCAPASGPPSGSPSTLAASPRGYTSVDLVWVDEVSGETSYEVQRAASTSGTCGTFTTVSFVSADATSAVVGGLATGTTYCFRVRGLNGYLSGSYSGWSNVATGATLPPPPAYVCSSDTYFWLTPASPVDLLLGDDSSSTRTLPFSFRVYDRIYTSITVAANGFVRFGGTAGTGAYSNVAIPNGTDPNEFAAPAWDDWNPGLAGQVTVGTVGVSPSRRYVVSWTGVPHFNVTGSAVSFQLVLEEETGTIRFQYRDMVVGQAAYDRGASATAGVEGADGAWGTQVSFNSGALTDLSAVACARPDTSSPSIVTSALQDGTTSAPYSVSLSASGGATPYVWSVSSGALPEGLDIDATSGAITGTPVGSAGTSSFTVKVAGSDGGTSTRALSIRVASPLSVTTSSLAAPALGVSYSQSLASSGGQSTVSWSLASGSLPTGLTLSAAGGITGTPTVAGSYSFTVRATDSGTPARTADKDFTLVVGSPPSISTSTFADATTTVSYSASLSATGGSAPYSYSLSSGSLPGGLSLSSGGAITGTPNSTGTFSFTVRVTGSDLASSTRALSIRVASPLSVTTSSLAAPALGVSYSQSLASSGGQSTVSWSISSGSLPTGLTLSAAGAITGTPTVAGSYSFTVRATDSGTPARTADRALTLTVAFGKSTPVDGTKLASGVLQVDLSWWAYSGATSYQWCVTTNSKGCASTEWVSTSSLTATMSGLARGKTYYWQVRAYSGTTLLATANSSTLWRFSTAR